MAAKRSLRLVQAVAILLALSTLIASWAVFERPHGMVGTIAAGIAPFMLFYILGIIFAALLFTRERPRRPNYPRIEHLRISGKYQAVGRTGEMGISPLDLRG